MSFIENVLNLIKLHHITKNKMLKDLKMGTGTFATWQKRGTIPNGDTLKKIADYFGVSTDYLLTGEEDKKSTGKAEDEEVPEDFAILARKAGNIPPEKRKQLYKFLNSTIDTFLEALEDEDSDNK